MTLSCSQLQRDRETDGQTDSQTDRQTDTHTHTPRKSFRSDGSRDGRLPLLVYHIHAQKHYASDLVTCSLRDDQPSSCCCAVSDCHTQTFENRILLQYPHFVVMSRIYLTLPGRDSKKLRSFCIQRTKRISNIAAEERWTTRLRETTPCIPSTEWSYACGYSQH